MKPFVDIHTHKPLKESLQVANFRLGTEQKPLAEPFSAGIHPWDAEQFYPTLDTICEQLTTLPCVAIGEIGLDRACSVPTELQQEVFERQIIIAQERNLPIVIHCVKAYNEVAKTLSKYSLRGVVFHGFIGSEELCRNLTNNGYSISFGFGALRSPKTIEAMRITPHEKLFLESDTSEQNIADLYAQVAHVKGINIEALREQIYNNYTKLFLL